ncbi:hypothetical protein C357_20380 [Citreicella sp. 357]|nr:hypothetical protein C357_20380 [Citreicella sp. 357]
MPVEGYYSPATGSRLVCCIEIIMPEPRGRRTPEVQKQKTAR